MKPTFNLLALLLVAGIFTSIVKGDSDIPLDLWEQHQATGVAVALTLKDHAIVVHVKNTSDTLKKLVNMGGNTFAKFFYIDAQNMSIPLANHRFYHDQRDDDSKEQGTLNIASHTVLSRPVAISPAEVTLVKTYPVTCTIIIYDPATKQRVSIKSIPKLLTEVIGK